MENESDKLDNLLDGLIDRALANYTPPQPRPGLEQRILASAAAAEIGPRQRGWNWRPVWALAAVATLVALVAIPVIVRSPRPEIAVVHGPAAAGVEDPVRAVPDLAASAQSTVNRASRRSHRSVHVPLQTQYGRPHPTKEELLMARFAAKDPAVMVALTASKPDLDAPVSMAAIPDNPIATESVEMKPITIAPIQTPSMN